MAAMFGPLLAHDGKFNGGAWAGVIIYTGSSESD